MKKIVERKMAKTEIAKIKKNAKKRENRRLAEGEYQRIMAQYRSKENIDLPIISDGVYGEIRRINVTKAESISSPKKVIQSYDYSNAPKCRVLQNKIAKILSIPLGLSTEHQEHKKTKAGNRLSNRQFKSLMNKASVELGINNKKGIGVINLSSNSEYSQDDLLDLIVYRHFLGRDNVAKDYKRIIKGKKFNFAEKLSVANYLINKTAKPTCLLSKSEKTDGVRKIVKTHGDIKVRPFRLIPDEEYFLERQNKKRTKLDYFDKMDIDSKIEWARYANMLLNISADNFTNIKFKTEEDARLFTFAMKYACRMSKIPEFKGGFANAHWILYRLAKYSYNMTPKEYNVFYQMALEYLGISHNKKTISIIGAPEAIKRLIPTLKARGVYKKYLDQNNSDTLANLDMAKKLIYFKDLLNKES